MTKFNQNSFFGGAVVGGAMGAMTGVAGALITGSDAGKTAVMLGAGMSAVIAARNFPGYCNPSGQAPTFFGATSGLAKDVVLSSSIGYMGCRLLFETAASALPVSEFAASAVAGYPVTLGIISGLILLDMCSSTKKVESKPEVSRPKMR